MQERKEKFRYISLFTYTLVAFKREQNQPFKILLSSGLLILLVVLLILPRNDCSAVVVLEVRDKNLDVFLNCLLLLLQFIDLMET